MAPGLNLPRPSPWNYGASGSDGPRQERRDTRRIVRAYRSLSSEELDLSKIRCASTEEHRRMHVRAQIVTARHKPQWVEKLNGSTKLPDRERVEALTELLAQIPRDLAAFNLELPGEGEPITCYLLGLLDIMHCIYKERAMYHIDNGDYAGTVDDATKGLRWVFPYGGTCGTKAVEDAVPGKPDREEINLLFIRGRALEWLGGSDNLARAIVDYRAGCAGIRMLGDDWKCQIMADVRLDPQTRSLSHEEAIIRYLGAMAKAKVNEGSGRPHYSDEERLSIEKELGVGMFCRDIYLCGQCKRKANEVKLRACSKCKNAWFCSEACQEKKWENGHRSECFDASALGPLPNVLPQADSQAIDFEKRVDDEGYGYMHHAKGPRVVVRDNETGFLFDSLWDGDVVFAIPSLHGTHLCGTDKAVHHLTKQDQDQEMIHDENP